MLYAQWQLLTEPTETTSGGGGGGGGTTSPTVPNPTDPGIGETIPENTLEPPTVSGDNTLVPSENNSYTEIGVDGVPLGTWNYDEDTQTWIFEPTEVPLGGLAKTGDTLSTWMLLLLSLGAGLILMGMIRKKLLASQKYL